MVNIYSNLSTRNSPRYAISIYTVDNPLYHGLKCFQLAYRTHSKIYNTMIFGVLGSCDLVSQLLAKYDMQQHWCKPRKNREIYVVALFTEA